MRLRKLIATIVACTVLSSSVACTHTPPQVPSAQLIAYEQTAIAALNAIAAGAQVAATVINPATNQPILSQADANFVTTGVAKINAILSAAQAGWPQAVAQAWTSFKASLSAAQAQQLVVVIAAGDVAVAALVAATSGGGSEPNLAMDKAVVGILIGVQQSNDANLLRDWAHVASRR